MKLLKADNIYDEITEGKCVLKFYTNSCESCKEYEPIFDEFIERYDGAKMKVAKINANENQELAQKFRIGKVPTTLFIKDGDIVSRKVGPLPYDRILMNVSHKLY